MKTEEEVNKRLNEVLINEIYDGDFWRGYAHALAEVIDVDISFTKKVEVQE